MPPALASINDALMVTFLFSMAAMVLGTAQGDPGKIIGRDRPTLLVFTWTTAEIASNMPPWFRGYRRSMVG